MKKSNHACPWNGLCHSTRFSFSMACPLWTATSNRTGQWSEVPGCAYLQTRRFKPGCCAGKRRSKMWSALVESTTICCRPIQWFVNSTNQKFLRPENYSKPRVSGLFGSFWGSWCTAIPSQQCSTQSLRQQIEYPGIEMRIAPSGTDGSKKVYKKVTIDGSTNMDRVREAVKRVQPDFQVDEMPNPFC